MKKYGKPVYYSDYLGLEKILKAQNPESSKYGSSAHDETLFIIVHQTYELWFKQILHEIDSIIEMFKKNYVDEENISISVSRLKRVNEIQKVMLEQFRVMETMTPLDFLEFRDLLVPASGFQSFQFRMIENKLGLKQDVRLKYNRNKYSNVLSEEHQQIVFNSENEQSLFTLTERWLERTPFLHFHNFDFLMNYQLAVERMLKNDRETILTNPILSEIEKENELKELEKTRENFMAIFSEELHNDLIQKGLRRFSYRATLAVLFINLYRDQPILHLPFMFLNCLIDIDEHFSTWRYRHSLMAQRMIGTKIGTGGSSGFNYLKETIEAHKIYTDLFNISTFLIPRSEIPELPQDVVKQLGFMFSQVKN